MNIGELQQQMKSFVQNNITPCKKCKFLHNDRKVSITFIIENNDKPVLIVGEAPGKTEYEKGCIFCGKSGQLLRASMKQAGYRNMIMINAVKCRPPENRTPEDEEIQNCLPYLQEQIRIITEAIPGIKIIAAGRTAEKALKQLEIDHKFIYHPAFLLRQGGSIEDYAETIRQALQEQEEEQKDETANLPMLHVHTDYSVRDGILTIDNLIRVCKKKGIPACVTDHGTMAGLYELEHKCIKDGIDHILGYEAYIECSSSMLPPLHKRDFLSINEELTGHLLILVKTKTGYINLLNLHNIHAIEGKNNRVNIYLTNLLQNCNGLVISTACIGSIIAEILKKYGEETAISVIKYLNDEIRAKGGEFYLEIMPHDIHEAGSRISQQKYNKFLERASRELKIPVIITTDVHYSSQDERELKVFASSSAYHKKELFYDKNYFPGNSYHMDLTKADIKKILLQQGLSEETIMQGLRNTEKLARELAEEKRKFRIFEKQEISDQQEAFEKLVSQKWLDFQKSLSEDEKLIYQQRLDREISLIKAKKYCNYFITLHKIMEEFRKRQIHTGISRGSGGGSLVAFLLGIVFLDPIKHGLLFERFLNEAREDPPDIDIDVQMSKREEAIQAIQDVVGNQNLAQISTYVTFQEKVLQRDLAWLEGKDYRAAALEAKDISKYQELLGVKKFKGTHASGFIIMDNVQSKLPLSPATTRDLACVELDLDIINALGIEKYDFLGLTVLDIVYSIPNAKQYLIDAGILTERGGFNANIKPELQKVVIDYINKYPLDVFQIGTESCIPILLEVKPSSFEELTHLISLNRPGPRDSGMVSKYVSRKGSSFQNKAIAKLLEETRGCCIFQEQLIMILKETFDLSFTEAEELRRIISKKRADKLAIWEKKLNISESEEKLLIWDYVNAWADYGFNKAHATGYAALSFISGYLKMIFPEEFYAAALNYETDEIMQRKLLKEARSQGIKFFKPQIDRIMNQFNTGPQELKKKILSSRGKSFTYDGGIVLGLITIEGIKEKQAENLIKKLKNRQRLTDKQIETLKKAGFWGQKNYLAEAFGSLGNIKSLSPYYIGLSDGRPEQDYLSLDIVHVFSHNGSSYCEDNREIYQCICIPEDLVLVNEPIRAYRYRNYVISTGFWDRMEEGQILYVSSPIISTKNNIYRRVLIKSQSGLKEGVMMQKDTAIIFNTVRAGMKIKELNLRYEGGFIKGGNR